MFGIARHSSTTLAIVLLFAASAQSVIAQEITAGQFQPMQARHIGPVGNRVTSIAGVAGDPFTYYAGAASGGIWKTEDGGINWDAIFDDYPIHAIGAITVAPSDPNVVWIGTGEPFIRSNVSLGNGVWRSTDAGDTWEHMGLDDTGRISRVIVHPSDPDVVYVAALGHAYAPQQERGIYRTIDGGETWEQVLFVDSETGASELVMDPSNPRILFAGMWSVKIRTWTRESGGPGSGIFMSKDAGDTWTRIEGHGLPEGEVGKIGLCMSQSDTDRIYALIETGDGVPWHDAHTDSGELWRSDDGGAEWEMVNANRDFAGRTAYYSRCAVSTNDPDEVYFLAAAYSITKDGGVTHTVADQAAAPNWDHHDMWIDPTNADRQVVSGDGGVGITENRGRSWFRVQLPVAQMYHVTVDNAVPYNVIGNRQDGPSVRGPSNSRLAGGFVSSGIPRGMSSSGRALRARAAAVASWCAGRRKPSSSACSKCGPRTRWANRPRICATGSSGASLCSSPHMTTTRSTSPASMCTARGMGGRVGTSSVLTFRRTTSRSRASVVGSPRTISASNTAA